LPKLGNTSKFYGVTGQNFPKTSVMIAGEELVGNRTRSPEYESLTPSSNRTVN